MSDPATLYAQAIDANNRRDFAQAQALSARVLAQTPAHAGAHALAGMAALNLQQIPTALRHLQQAVDLEPLAADHQAQLARALTVAHRMPEAVAAADAAFALSPSAAWTLDTLGVIYTRANAHDKALAAFRRAAALMPTHAGFRFNLATSLSFAGDLEGAEREYAACVACDRHFWKAHLSLSQMRKQLADNNHVAQLRSVLVEATGNPEALMLVHMALAKEYEDLGEYASAFEHMSAGKIAGRRMIRYTSAQDAALVDALIRAFPEPRPRVSGQGSAEPIFVIGMPRSGTTLIDRILSSHPAVHSAGELQNFGLQLKRLSGSRTPALLDAETIAHALRVDPTQLGDAYLASARPNTGHAKHFVDKLPHNFLYAGFIAQALPNARIVCLRRNPLDTCVSNFRQMFALNSPFHGYSFDLLDIGRYYVLFDRLMAHWRRVLPGRILEIDYETMVGAQEDTTRQLLAFCGLAWDDACLHFEQNETAVTTASLMQVREPIHRGRMQRWKLFENQLGELRALLVNAGIELPE